MRSMSPRWTRSPASTRRTASEPPLWRRREHNDELAIANDLIELEDAAAAAWSAEDVIASELAEHSPTSPSAAKAKTTPRRCTTRV